MILKVKMCVLFRIYWYILNTLGKLRTAMHVESLYLEERVQNQLAKATVCCVPFEKKWNYIFPGENKETFFFT
jgi:hypothetical protein